MKYRITNDRNEIINSLTSKLSKNCSITVWQKQIKNERIVLGNMTFGNIYEKEGVFTLKADNPSLLAIDPEKDVYFLVDDHDYIFKTNLATLQKNTMTLEIPKEVQLKEFRCYEREVFNLKDQKSVDVIFSAKKDFKRIKLCCPIINISEAGACFLITKESMSIIDFTADILFKLYSNNETAIIRYVKIFTKKNLKSDENYAIGVKFQ